ncbi:MAG: endonuclease [Verrucomicrobia bacterium]|nr:MAG: endonuclease [Verrucomicrobiota bacterium]
MFSFFQILKKFKKLIRYKRNQHSITNTKSTIGKKGEELAKNFLKKEKKFKIITSNWTHKKDEIDIIAKEGQVLVFIEVKTRTDNKSIFTHYLSVTKKKKKNLARAAKAYLKCTKPTPIHFRFDIILVKLCKNQGNHIHHYSNIKLFSKNFHSLTYD